ncbi:MAG: helix-turn-helix domain-containing protein [Chitinophagales bacterium]
MLFVFILKPEIFANENLSAAYLHIFSESPDSSFVLDLKDFSWVDSYAEYQASELLLNGMGKLEKAKSDSVLPPYAALWSVIRFENREEQAIEKYIQFSNKADDIEVYIISENELDQKLKSGKNIPPPQKFLHSNQNYIPLNIKAGETTEIVIRQLVKKQTKISALTLLEIHTFSKLNNQRLFTFSAQAFYLGLFLLMCIAGFIIGLISKKILHPYFALFILSLGLYFPYFHGFLDDLYFYKFHNNFFEFGELILTGIVLFGFLFLSEYFELKNKKPKYYRAYLGLSIFSGMFTHSIILLYPDSPVSFQIRYFMILLWMCTSIYFFIWKIRSDKEKRKLHTLAVTAMIGGIVVVAISALEPNFYHAYLHLSFQLGLLFFSGILFYDLFLRKHDALESSENLVKAAIVPEPLIAEVDKSDGAKNEVEAILEAANPSEKVLLEKVFQTIDLHLENPDFSAEALAKEIGYSRVHLNRKLKPICNLSINKVMLMYRLNIASKMLENGTDNVNEVAFKAGFGSASYFVKCFRDKYGKTPGMLKKDAK